MKKQKEKKEGCFERDLRFKRGFEVVQNVEGNKADSCRGHRARGPRRNGVMPGPDTYCSEHICKSYVMSNVFTYNNNNNNNNSNNNIYICLFGL